MARVVARRPRGRRRPAAAGRHRPGSVPRAAGRGAASPRRSASREASTTVTRAPASHEVRRQHALAAADVEDLLARPRLEQVERGRDGELAVVRRAVVPDPAVVPGGDPLPARLARGAALCALDGPAARGSAAAHVAKYVAGSDGQCRAAVAATGPVHRRGRPREPPQARWRRSIGAADARTTPRRIRQARMGPIHRRDRPRDALRPGGPIYRPNLTLEDRWGGRAQRQPSWGATCRRMLSMACAL